MRLTHQALLLVVGAVAAAAVIGMIVLWPRGPEDAPAAGMPQDTEVVDATLVSVTDAADAPDNPLAPNARTVDVTAQIEETGDEVTFETTDESGDLYQAGQKVRLTVIRQEGLPTTYLISDFRRGGALAVLVGAFVVAVLGFGRIHGLRALVGLVATFGLIVWFMVPAILDGRSPLAVAIVGSCVIVTLTLYLSHGFSPKTSAAVVGTALSLLVTGVLAVIFVAAANITGFASEEARLANVSVGGLSLRGLLLAGVVIGGLGVLDDVTMTQASTVFALRRANPQLGFGDLITRSMVVGRDHIAATVNTLFLAYAGASLPLLILFAVGTEPVSTLITTEIVAVELVRTLVGSIGLIAAVPLTSALAAAVVAPGPERPPEAHEVSSHEDVDAGPLAPSADEDEEWEAALRRAYRLPAREPQRPADPPGDTNPR